MNEARSAMLARVEKRRDIDARFYKPACLIAVIDGVADGSLAASDIEPDRVVARFAAYIGDLFPERAQAGWRPFWHLSRDGAWIFTKEGRVVGPEDFKRQRKPNRRRELMSKIDLAAVPQELRRHWRSPADRAELRAAIIAMLRRDNDDCRRVADRLEQDQLIPFLPDPEAAELAIEEGTPGGRRGQGFLRSAAARRAVENRAMAVAYELLEREGWQAEDVSTRRCYDFHCTRGADTLFVEVKGTTGTGEEIHLTAGEVAFAVRNRPAIMLIVVAGVTLKEHDGEAIATGGKFFCLHGWAPAPGDLDPISYQCRISLPDQ
jgi:hypothetical protein